MYQQGFSESPSLFKYSFSDARHSVLMASVCCRPFATCNTSLGFIFFSGTLLASLSTSPACLMCWQILFRRSVSLIKYSTASNLSLMRSRSFIGISSQRFSRRAPMGDTVLLIVFKRLLFSPINSRLRMVNLSIHR